MKITNKNFEKKARDIMKLIHDEWYVDEIEESKVMKWTEVEWIKKIIDRGYSVTFKKEGSTMENKNNNQIWSPQQEKVINELHNKIDNVKVELSKKIDDNHKEVKSEINQMNHKFDKIFKHLGIE